MDPKSTISRAILRQPEFFQISFIYGIFMRARLFLQQLEGRDLPSTYFVATNGTDGAAGTQAAPWLTLQYAVDQVNAGDTIEVESGTYAGCRIGNNGKFNCNNGTATDPITLEAAPGATVVVNTPGASNYHGSDIEVEDFNYTMQYWTISGIECEDASTAGIDIRTSNYITVENCTCTTNNDWGIFLAFSNDPVIENNICEYSVTQHGIYDSNSADGATVIGNICNNNYDCGIEFNGDVTQGSDGYMADNLIADNIIYDNGAGGGAGLNFDGLIDSTIENNLLYGNQAGGIVLYHYNASEGSIDNVVVNNTIVMPSGSGWAVNINADSTGNVLYNNIFYFDGSNSGCIEITSDSLAGFVSNYNIFNGSPSFSTDGDNTSISLAQWQSTTQQDAHSFTATTTALFADYSSDDFLLASTSPAIGAGTTTDEPATDLLGNARPSNSDDIGAYQYVSSSSHIHDHVTSRLGQHLT